MCYHGLVFSSGAYPSLFHLTIPIKPDPLIFRSKPKYLTRLPVSSFRPNSTGKFSAPGTSATAPEHMTFYELMGIPESVTLPEIKQAYKQLARRYHPDVSPPGRVEEFTQRFIRVQEAYETLSDPKRRALYDHDLALGLHLAFSSRRRYQS